MKHLLMDPAFPDLVAAVAEQRRRELKDWRRDDEPAPAADAFMIFLGQREAPLERARGDAAIDIVGVLALGLFFFLAARDDQHVLLGGDVELVGLEPGNRELDPILVLAELDEVERREILLALPEAVVFNHVEQPVESDR